MKRLVYLGVTALVVLIVAFLIARETEVTDPRTAGGAPTPNQGTAHDALGANRTGFSVNVDSTERDASPTGVPSPPAGTHNVVVKLHFQSVSNVQQRADWHDFELRDSIGQTWRPVLVAGTPCQEWPKTDLVPATDQPGRLRDSDAQRSGPSFGPVTLCFQVGGPATDPLTLIWDPDVSMPLLNSATEIPLQ